MKKIMMCAAVLALLATGCQNEVLVEQSQPQEGQLFTLEVGRGISSRTEMGDNNATNWSTDDAIFVSGENGGVHGVLKFVGYGEDKSIATFSGYISGGQPSKLQHIVFPVPEDGKIDMSKRNPGKLDAPMVGTIGNGAVQTLNNVGGLLAFKMLGGEGNVYGVSATAGTNNMTGGYYTFNAENGTLDYNPVNNVTPAMVMEDGYVYVPVATTTDETDGTGAKTEVTVDVTVTNLETESTVIEGNGIEITSGKIIGDEEGENKGLDTGVIEGEDGAAVKATVVSTADELVAALENKENVYMISDIKIDPANMSNAYGTTGINVKSGQSIDGGGHTLNIKGAGGTWDSGINTTGGLIKNITVTGSFRGIFINHNSEHSETVVLDHVIIEGTTYTISCDQGLNQNLEAYDCTFKGWTSFAKTLGTAKFTDCTFGYGAGYNYSRPYAPTEYVRCNFEKGHQLDARAAVTFEDCKLDGKALTAENLATLVTSNIANAKIVINTSMK